jgi:hypothetical protein
VVQISPERQAAKLAGARKAERAKPPEREKEPTAA